METFDDVLAEVRRKREERQGFGNQFLEGAKNSASLGYAGSSMPENLPLTGKIGRVTGEMAGAIPALTVGSEVAGAMGLTGLGAELLSGALYGGISKPEENESRITNAMKDAALFGGTYAAIKGAGKAVGRMFGGGEKAATGEVAKTNEVAGQQAGEIGGTPLHFPGAKPTEEGEGSPFGLFKSPEDLTAYKTKMEDTNYLRDRTMGTPDNFSPYEKPPAGPQIEGMGKEFLSPFNFENPEEMIKAQKVMQYDRMINSWAKDFIRIETPPERSLKVAGNIAQDDLEAASAKMTKDSGLHNISETPVAQLPEKVPLPKLEEQHALQSSIDAIVEKNALTIPTIQAASQVEEPINFLMSKGVNFEDSAELVEKITERAKTNLEPKPAQTVSFTGKNAPKPVPPWEVAKARSYTPDEVYDLFYNVPLKGADALKHGLLEPKAPDMNLHLTEKGYAFLKQYNPEGLIGEFPEFISKKSLGSIRAQGYSNLNHSGAELKELGFKMSPDTALQKGFVRPATRSGKPVEGQYQLTDKGSAFLAGGKGANANVNLKAYDTAAGRRVPPGETEQIALMKVENKRNKLLFKDVFAEVKDLAKGCPE